MSSNIQPAFNLEDAALLTADDFQRQLCSFLQNRGLLSELRAYFKSNMIEILRNTSASSSLGLQPQAPSSPKMQAINLLVAEYMSLSQYHFSLCVFGTEVALNKIFYNNRDKFKFNQKEVLDILETLGIMRHNKQAKCIYLLYQQGEEPLLNYFLPTPPIHMGQIEAKDYFFSLLDNDYDFGIHNINRILLNSNISPEEVNQLKFAIKWICDKHKEKEKQLEANLKVEFKTQLSKYKMKLYDSERCFEVERGELKNEISYLRDQLTTAKQKQKEGDDRVNKCLQRRMEDIKLKERQSNIKKVNVSVSTSNIPMECKASQCQIAMQENDDLGKGHVCLEQQYSKSIANENILLKQTIQKLEQENEILRADNHGFSKELDHLALRASALMAELNISQQNILRLNGILHSTVDVSQVLPLAAINPQQVLSYTGAGEEYLRTSSIIPPHYRHLSRMPRQRSPQNMSTSSSSRSGSPTEAILHDAKQKLKHLEQESMIIDKRISKVPRSTNSKTHRHHLPSTPMTSPCPCPATSPQSNSGVLFEFGAENGMAGTSSKVSEAASAENNTSDTEQSATSHQPNDVIENKQNKSENC